MATRRAPARGVSPAITLARTLLDGVHAGRIPLVIAAALLVSCMVAGIVVVVAGRTLAPKTSAHAMDVREARAVMTGAASELVTSRPLSAPAKAAPLVGAPAVRAMPRGVVVRTLVPARSAPPPSTTVPTAPAGFGHLGADRETSPLRR